MKNVKNSELNINKIYITEGKKKEFWKNFVYEINSDEANIEITSTIYYYLLKNIHFELTIYIIDFILDYGSEKIIKLITNKMFLVEIEKFLKNNSAKENDLKRIILFLIKKWATKFEKKEDFEDFFLFYDKYKINIFNGLWEPVSYKKYILFEDLMDLEIIKKINKRNINYLDNHSNNNINNSENNNKNNIFKEKNSVINTTQSNTKIDNNNISNESNIFEEKINIYNNNENNNKQNIEKENFSNIKESKVLFSVNVYENENYNGEKDIPFSIAIYDNQENNNNIESKLNNIEKSIIIPIDNIDNLKNKDNNKSTASSQSINIPGNQIQRMISNLSSKEEVNNNDLYESQKSSQKSLNNNGSNNYQNNDSNEKINNNNCFSGKNLGTDFECISCNDIILNKNEINQNNKNVNTNNIDNNINCSKFHSFRKDFLNKKMNNIKIQNKDFFNMNNNMRISNHINYNNKFINKFINQENYYQPNYRFSNSNNISFNKRNNNFNNSANIHNSYAQSNNNSININNNYVQNNNNQNHNNNLNYFQNFCGKAQNNKCYKPNLNFVNNTINNCNNYKILSKIIKRPLSRDFDNSKITNNNINSNILYNSYINNNNNHMRHQSYDREIFKNKQQINNEKDFNFKSFNNSHNNLYNLSIIKPNYINTFAQNIMNKVFKLNEWINEGKFSYHNTYKNDLKNGINYIKNEISTCCGLVEKSEENNDFNNSIILKSVIDDINQTIKRYEDLTNDKIVQQFISSYKKNKNNSPL